MTNINSIFDSSLSSMRLGNENKENDSLLVNQKKVTASAVKGQKVGTEALKGRGETLDSTRSLSPRLSSLRSRRILRSRNAPYQKIPEQQKGKGLNSGKDSISAQPAIEKSASVEHKEEQSEFFTHREPAEWFALQRDGNGKITLNLPSSLHEVGRLIYVFRNRETGCLLIGKTAGSLNKRSSGYLTRFNELGSEDKVKKKGTKAFLKDVKQNPEQFEVGILHVLKPEEDLDLFESLFIKYKGQISPLYNENGGGGGGSAHSEENATTYVIPKEEVAPFTPVKYYSYGRNDEGDIRPQFTPGFKKRLRTIKDQLGETQEFAYAIKKMDTGERYIGVSGSPRRRAREHAYAAEYHDPEHDKFDPTRKDGALHPAMAEEPEQFGFGLLPIQSIEKIDPAERENFVLLEGIAHVERYIIAMKESLISQNGFNMSRGGEGPIAKRATRMILK
jgi:hypothetical protein